MPKKSKTTNKTKSKELVKPLTRTEVRERFQNKSYYDLHPDHIYEKMGKLLANYDKDKSSINEEELKYLIEKIWSIDDFSLRHINLANTVPNKMATSIVELANNLIEEYECNTTLEKTLCEIISNSYWKIMSISKKLDASLEFDYFWSERNGFIWVMSKELDRANRNYLTALNNLIDIKRPQMNINVKTNNAYFSQNQQINNNQEKNENIKD